MDAGAEAPHADTVCCGYRTHMRLSGAPARLHRCSSLKCLAYLSRFGSLDFGLTSLLCFRALFSSLLDGPSRWQRVLVWGRGASSGAVTALAGPCQRHLVLPNGGKLWLVARSAGERHRERVAHACAGACGGSHGPRPHLRIPRGAAHSACLVQALPFSPQTMVSVAA